MNDHQACENTDREIWRGPDEGGGDFYADSLHITKGGALGINCGGSVYVKPIREWHRLAGGPIGIKEPNPAASLATLKDIIAAYEWCSVDPVDRGYSSLDSEIHRAKHLLALSNGHRGGEA